MNIKVVDSQSILSEKQMTYAKNRLYFSLVRFEHRINGATIHFSLNDNSERVKCTINVRVEGAGIISAKRSCSSSDEVVNLTVDALEPRVACRVDWRAWFNADTFSTWLLSVSQPLKWPFGFARGDKIPSATRSGKNKKPVAGNGSQPKPRLLNGPQFGIGANRANAISNN